jgi:hypothetical protein
VQQAHGVGIFIVRAERIGAHELGKARRLVRLGHAYGPHLVQNGGHTGTGDLPSGLAAGKTAADDVDGLGHGVKVSENGRCLNRGTTADEKADGRGSARAVRPCAGLDPVLTRL